MPGKKSPDRTETPPGKVTYYIGQCDVPQSVDSVLRCRPKYATEPNESPVAMLSLVRNISDKATADNKERCVSEGVDCLLSKCCRNKPRNLVKHTVGYLKEKDLALLASDKEGGFVVMTKGVFHEKAGLAVAKNFVTSKYSGAELKKKAISRCSELIVSSVRKRISSAKKDSLNVFFSVKTHKIDMPFRAIVTE